MMSINRDSVAVALQKVKPDARRYATTSSECLMWSRCCYAIANLYLSENARCDFLSRCECDFEFHESGESNHSERAG